MLKVTVVFQEFWQSSFINGDGFWVQLGNNQKKNKNIAWLYEVDKNEKEVEIIAELLIAEMVEKLASKIKNCQYQMKINCMVFGWNILTGLHHLLLSNLTTSWKI